MSDSESHRLIKYAPKGVRLWRKEPCFGAGDDQLSKRADLMEASGVYYPPLRTLENSNTRERRGRFPRRDMTSHHIAHADVPARSRRVARVGFFRADRSSISP